MSGLLLVLQPAVEKTAVITDKELLCSEVKLSLKWLRRSTAAAVCVSRADCLVFDIFPIFFPHCAELCCPVQAKLSTNQHSTYVQRHCYMSLSAAHPEWRKGSTQADKHTSGSRSCFFCACKKLQKPNSTLIILLWSRAEFCRLVYWPCWTPECMTVSFFSAISMI